MSKIKLTLKWRLTLFAMMIVAAASAILVFTINYDIKHTMPKLKNTIISAGDPSYIDGNQIYIEDGIFDEIDGDGNMIIAMAIEEATLKIYWFSIMIFALVLVAAGACIYFMVDRALIPVVELNKNIKKINEDNLTSNLNVEGPDDEIKDLTLSFNKMIGKLENAFMSQKRFNSSVAHELKTPLAAIKTNIDVLKSSSTKTIEDYEMTMKIVDKSILRMNSIIETLLDMIRQENAPLNDTINIEQILEDIADDLSVIAHKKNVEVNLSVDDNISEIMGNEILLYRAFYNIVENGIKYNKDNGSIKISCSSEGSCIKVKIEDTGKGIKLSDYEEIFKPFYRCDEFNIKSENGLGLGLALTQSAIKLHGGEIKVKSELDKGTEFTVIIPVNKI
ncbi:HAMP domain-containing sensor histidine kinase [uncultured Clostridium sp.]|uniref:sensor histidine kinase n=1 Tax=uncultured Clostridium sp. TaxID=59620 RepID=UPI0025E4E223|nr:HAMP domain-containing sensor histidine kinase [uncultured Clostridium sp.]